MNINITGQNIDISAEMKNHINKEIQKMQQYFDNFTSANVTINEEKLNYKANMTVQVPGNTLRASSNATDIRTSIDQLFNKIYQQVKKHKEKLLDKHR